MNEDQYEEIKARVVENKHSREDVLVLIEMIDNVNGAIEDIVQYVLEEAEVNSEDQVQEA